MWSSLAGAADSLRQVIDLVGGGPHEGRHILGVLTGVSAGVLTAEHLDTPLTHEHLAAAGGGLGAAGFLVLDDETDIAAVAIDDRVSTVADESRCALARQHQDVVGSLRRAFPEHFADHVAGRRDAVDPLLVAPLIDVRDGVVTVDEGWLAKQPDWSFDKVDAGRTPVERLSGP